MQLNASCVIKVNTVVVVLYGNEALKAGVTQSNSRLYLSCNWVRLASSGSLPNTKIVSSPLAVPWRIIGTGHHWLVHDITCLCRLILYRSFRSLYMIRSSYQVLLTMVYFQFEDDQPFHGCTCTILGEKATRFMLFLWATYCSHNHTNQQVCTQGNGKIWDKLKSLIQSFQKSLETVTIWKLNDTENIAIKDFPPAPIGNIYRRLHCRQTLKAHI